MSIINLLGGKMKKLITLILSIVFVLGFMTVSSNAKTLKCQTVLNAKSDEARLLKEEFTDKVTLLTGGSLEFENTSKCVPNPITYFLSKLIFFRAAARVNLQKSFLNPFKKAKKYVQAGKKLTGQIAGSKWLNTLHPSNIKQTVRKLRNARI